MPNARAEPRALSSSSGSSLRVGVLGASRILRTAWRAIHEAGHTVTYVGSRDTTKCLEMIKSIVTAGELPRIGSYEDVISSSIVDIVYITLPVAKRDKWVMACVDAGKHVVGEKPSAASASQLLRWLEAMHPRRLLYMDGTYFTHGCRLAEVKTALKTLGRMQHIDVQMCFQGTDAFFLDDIRCNTSLEPHGALGDLGWYGIRWVLHLVDFALPERVSGRIISCTEAGGITAFEGHMLFTVDGEPVSATLFCSFEDGYAQSVKVIAQDGTVDVHGAINPTGEDAPGYRLSVREWRAPDAAAVSTATPLQVRSQESVRHSAPQEMDASYQSTQLWRNVGQSLMCLGKGEPLLLDAEKGSGWARYAYLTQVVMDRMLEAAMLLETEATS